MKLDVIIPSLGREQSMAAVICALHALESQANDVRYVVICDDDDQVTRAVAHGIHGINVVVDCGPRELVNKRENDYIRRSNADAFMPWADDLYALSPAWDEITRRVLEKVPAFSWQEVQDPQNHTAIVLSREWVQAVGRFFPEHFPFWFSDTWLKEVFGFVYGANMPIIEALRFSHKRGATAGMRDLDFWFRVFAHTRGERIEEAKRVCAALGREWQARPELVAMFEQGDAMQLERVSLYEQAFGANAGAASAAYAEAKAKAERLFSVEHAFSEPNRMAA